MYSGTYASPTLTSRETEVLEMIANGLSAKEAALSIGIAPRTVERHVENVRMKMRARNRVHMITCAVGRGMLAIEPKGHAVALDEMQPELDLH